MRALFTFRYDDRQMKQLEELGIDITYLPEEELEEGTSVAGYDFMVCFNPFSRLDFTDCHLKWIQLVSKGVGQVPESLRNAPGIVITNNVSGPAVPIGELIVTYILELFKNARFFFDNQRKARWEPNTDILEITGKTIGFLGTGKIAQEAAYRLKPFHAKIIGTNTTGHKTDGFDETYPTADLITVLEQSDVVVSTLPATDETYHTLNQETLGYMKRGSSLINISRGSVIDEEALCRYLSEDYFRGVALDVFEEEPLPESSPLWSNPRVIVTPHNALYSDWYNRRVFEMIYDNVVRFLKGNPLEGIVDYSRGY